MLFQRPERDVKGSGRASIDDLTNKRRQEDNPSKRRTLIWPRNPTSPVPLGYLNCERTRRRVRGTPPSNHLPQALVSRYNYAYPAHQRSGGCSPLDQSVAIAPPSVFHTVYDAFDSDTPITLVNEQMLITQLKVQLRQQAGLD
jgi:hypothetical protein